MLQHKLRQYQLAGHDLGQLIDRITDAPLTGARSISSVLHGRLEALRLDSNPRDVTWAQRTPQTASDVAHEVADGLDSRLTELGERAIAEPQPWLVKHLGMLSPNASSALREDYARRAGIAAGYREAAGITDPEQAISAGPHSASPELDAMREAAIGALEITEDSYRAMTLGQLEAKVAEGDRAQALAPPDVSGQLRLTAQAEADAWQQSADAEVRHDQVESGSAKALAAQLGAEKARLEGINADYENLVGQDCRSQGNRGSGQGRTAPPRRAAAGTGTEPCRVEPAVRERPGGRRPCDRARTPGRARRREAVAAGAEDAGAVPGTRCRGPPDNRRTAARRLPRAHPQDRARGGSRTRPPAHS